MVFTVFRLLTDFVCLYNYEFGLSLCKIVRSSVILLLPLFVFFLLAIVLSVLRYTDSDYPFVSSNSSLIHPINRFNPRHMLFLFRASTWISNAICRDLFVWGERWLLLSFIFVVLLTITSKPTIIRTINIVALSNLYNCLTCCL